jgi:hypothetical protein
LELLLDFLPISSHSTPSPYHSIYHAYKLIPLFFNISSFLSLLILHELFVQRIHTCYICTNHPPPFVPSSLPHLTIKPHPTPPNNHQIHNRLPRHPDRPHPRPPLMVSSRQIAPTTDFAPRGSPLHRAPANALAG